MFIRKYGEPLAFFFFNEELATMTESNKRAFADLNTMDRLAYDLGAEFGSDSLSEASYNADVDIIYCSLFCGTQNALNEYINKRAIEGGNCTRKIMTRIDEEILGEDAPRFRPQTQEERITVERMVDRLMDETYNEDDLLQPTHQVPMEWMDASVKRWCHQQRMIVLKTGSRAHNCFYKRSSVSAWRMAALLYHLWGEQETARRALALGRSDRLPRLALLGTESHRHPRRHPLETRRCATSGRLVCGEENDIPHLPRQGRSRGEALPPSAPSCQRHRRLPHTRRPSRWLQGLRPMVGPQHITHHS